MRHFINLLMVTFFITNVCLAEYKKMDLLDAASQGLVRFEVKRTNESFNQKGLELFVSNSGKEALIIKVDPALIFEASDSAYQDLLVAGSEVLRVEPGKTRSVNVQTYCAKSTARSPNAQLAFVFKTQADSNIIATIGYMRSIGANVNLSQQAVWFLTDQVKDLSAVFDTEQEKGSIQLRRFLSQRFNIPLPAYHTERSINTEPDLLARAPQTLKLHVNMEWEQYSPEVLSLSLFNARNERIASYFENTQVRKGKGRITASFETASYPKGNYSVRLYNDTGNVIKEVKVRLE